MKNAGMVVIGVVVGFVVFFGFPFYYNIGKANVAPKLKYDTPAILEYEKEHGKKACVEPKEFMAGEHMQMLNQWRDSVVRSGNRIYVNSRGENFTMSLQNTCLNCHSNKKDFCDKCHNYLAVNPYCFSCHIVPKEGGQEKAVSVAPARIYFEVGSSALPQDASLLLQPIVDFLRANTQAGVDVSGYVDKTGDPVKNAELAKNRAKVVRDMLISAGVSEAQINMKKPEILTGAGSDVEARRVEVSIASGKGV